MADQPSEPPVITETQAARIHAKAWAEFGATDLEDLLDKNPAAAIDRVRHDRPDFRIDPNARLVDLEYISGGLDFQHLPKEDLQEIYTYGTHNHIHVDMDRSEWLPPPPKPSKPIQQKPEGISLQAWARIYAYIWYQLRFNSNNGDYKARFEKDPATVTNEIVPILNSLPPLPSPPPRPPVPQPIVYQLGTTPLITHGDPPLDPGNAQGFKDIMNAWDAKGYLYRVRYCC